MAKAKFVKKPEASCTRLPNEEQIQNAVRTRLAFNQTAFTTIPEIIAESKSYEKNVLIEKLKTLYPQDPDMFYIEYYYPWAVNGPLYVDCPEFQADIEECEKKRKVMVELGLRYLIMRPCITEKDARMQLGEARL